MVGRISALLRSLEGSKLIDIPERRDWRKFAFKVVTTILATSAAAGLLVLLLVGIAAFLLSGSLVSRDVVAVRLSPSGTMQAVVEEVNGGATTSFGYDIYLDLASTRAKTRVKVAHAYDAARSEQAYGVMPVWLDETTLEVQYYKAKRVKLIKPRVSLGSDSIEVRFRAGVSDPSAPPGGMLYNLQGRPPWNKPLVRL